MEQPSMLDQLRALDERVLAEVVRQDQRCPDFVITSWQVDRISGGIANPDGLFRFSGTGINPAHPEDEQAWSVVLKSLPVPEEEGDLTSIWYWKREVLAAQSGLLEDLPDGGVKAPRFYGTVEQNGSAWIWMEYVRDSAPPRWPHSYFPTAAFRLGRMNGAYLNGRPLPDYPWLSRDQSMDFGNEVDMLRFLDHPRIQKVVPNENGIRLQRICEAKGRFFQVSRALPQVFSHCDSSRRNLIFRENAEGDEEIVGVDWAWCGIAPIGWDLSMLLPDNAFLFEMEPEELSGMEEAVFPAYLEGLDSAGWRGDRRLVRLGYCVSAISFPLLPMIHGFAVMTGEETNILQTGCGFEEVAPGWRVLVEHLLDLGEEALALMDELDLGKAAG